MSIVHGHGPMPADIMIIGEAPGEEEVRRGIPFCGQSGDLLDKMLHEAGLNRSSVFVTNVCRVRPPQNDITVFIPEDKKNVTTDMVMYRDRWVSPHIISGIATLEKEISFVQPKVIITLGNVPLWAITGNWGITKWRGSILQSPAGHKVIPMFHPAAILRNWEWRFITVHDLRRAAEESRFGEVRYPPYRFLIRPSFAETISVLETLEDELSLGPRKLAVDIETRRGYTSCIGIGWSRLEAICIPFMRALGESNYWSLEEEIAVRAAIKRVVTHPNARVVGQYFLYDAQYFWAEDRYVPNVTDDTIIKHHVLFPGTPRGLDYLSSLYCSFHRYWKDEGKEWVAGRGEDENWEYNCKDCVITFEVSEVQDVALEQTGLVEVWKFQQQLFWPVLAMMIQGVLVNKDLQAKIGGELAEATKERHAYIERVLGHSLNPKSPKQMQALFYGDFALKPILHKKSKKPTLDDDALTRLAVREPLLKPLITILSDVRTLGVFKSTFIDAEVDPDGRSRCSYDITGAETYRFSSSVNAFGRGLNHENIPSDKSKSIQKAKNRGSTFKLPNIRTIFVPPQGYRIFDIDLDRADLQVVVWESNDLVLKQMLREGADIHSVNAKVLGIHRELAKVFCHGTNYGGSARTMAAHIGVTVHTAERIQKIWFAEHPGIRGWHKRIEEELMTKRYVTNKFGYRRFYFDRIEEVLPEALGWIPQSTVACVINRALMRIAVSLPDVQLLIQVHDSLTGQFPDSMTQELLPKIQELSRIVIPYDDPLTIPTSIKSSLVSWGDAKGDD